MNGRKLLKLQRTMHVKKLQPMVYGRRRFRNHPTKRCWRKYPHRPRIHGMLLHLQRRTHGGTHLQH
jgi:hypothetical protein